jgi:hypothetical protein
MKHRLNRLCGNVIVFRAMTLIRLILVSSKN